MPYAHLEKRQIPVLFYTYLVDDVEYDDDMGRDPEALPRFYRFLEEGKLPKTSQINTATYLNFFEGLLQKGDLLHISFSSGQSGSVHNAEQAAELLREKYPKRRIVVIDSTCSSSGYGMLVDAAADLRDAGKTLDEVQAWLMEKRKCLHHQFFSTDLSFFRRSGRMSGAAATIGSILNICPIMRLDDAGCIIAYDKVHGRRNAIRVTVENMLLHAEGGADYAGKCFICNSNCPESAELLKAAILEKFPRLSASEVHIFDIGTIIASHCGPGTTAVFFFGDERPVMK